MTILRVWSWGPGIWLPSVLGKLTLLDPDTLFPRLKVREAEEGKGVEGRGVAGQVYMGAWALGVGGLIERLGQSWMWCGG